MQYRLLLLFIWVVAALTAGAQPDKKAVRNAARYFSEALDLKAARKHTEACAALERSISYIADDPDAYSLLGQWYFEAHNFEKAAETFKAASVKCLNGKFRFAKPLTRSLIFAGRADEALNCVNTFATIRDSAEWNQYRRQATFVRDAMRRSWGVWPQNLGVRINTGDPELFPSMAVDTGYLYFTRRINNMDEELYVARADSCGGWFAGRNIGDPPNTTSQESAQFISADGHYLFFTRCENRSENGAAEGDCDLYMAYRVSLDSAWTIAQPFGQTINNTSYEGMPTLSPDNRELYFVSNRKGGIGGYDIWVSRFEDGLWQVPVNAGPSINTPGNETTPYIAADNKTLFFASDTRLGFGGTDLFVSRRRTDGTWSIAENLGYPINSPHDEKTAFVSLDAKTLYFASDRNGSAGNYDIYKVHMPLALAPAPVSYLQGFVIDSISREKLNSAIITICNAVNGDTLYELRSNRGDGSYVVTLPPENTYALHSARLGYKEVSDTVIMDTTYMHRPLTHNIAMLTHDYNPIKPIHDTLIASVHFDVNITDLSPVDKKIIADALTPWIEEKGIVIHINAYTDNTGTPMINEELSYKRAAIVAREVASFGIDESSIAAKGWGETNAVATNDTEEGRYRNRRVEVIISR